MRRLPIIACLLALSFALAPAAVSFGPPPQDFTIRVPVKLTNIHPDITQVLIKASVTHVEHPSECNSFACLIGSKGTWHTIVNGAVDATFAISFDANDGKNPHLARGWKATITVHHNGQFHMLCDLMSASSGYPQDPSQPCVDKLSGPLP